MSRSEIADVRVLVVEDDYLLGTELAEILHQAGAHVIGPVGNVRDALGAFSLLPNVTSLDVQLGAETSFPVADELARRGVPFVFATGAANKIPVLHAARLICLKPVSQKTMLKALADALECSCASVSPALPICCELP